jgi:hypothetical protein
VEAISRSRNAALERKIIPVLDVLAKQVGVCVTQEELGASPLMGQTAFRLRKAGMSRTRSSIELRTAEARP